MNKSINRFLKAYPWYSGFTGDLLFYIAVDTLFLTLVKNFTPAEIVSITSLSQLACIVLQLPILFIIMKIGNTASLRTGAVLLLSSALFITFGQSYYLVLLGRILHDAAIIFRNASVVALENNLDMVDKRSEFVRLRTSGNTVYSVITMLIAFVASYMFNLNNYLPMYGCITTCTVGVIISFFMKDCSDNNKIAHKKHSEEKVKINYSLAIILAVVLYSVFYACVTGGQSEGKLFIQQHVLLNFDEEDTSLIIGAIICFSRIIRVLSNLMFAKLYEKYQSKMGMALPVLLCSSLGCLLFGSFIPQIAVKIVVMGIGYTIILFVRDPFKLYIQDVVFDITPKEQHQTLLTVLELGVKIVTAGTGLGFAAILVGYPMIVVIALLFAITVIEIDLSVWLYKAILRDKAERKDVSL